MKIVRRPRLRDLLLPASIIVSFLASSSAPTPLYAAYADRWHFSPITTTAVFGVYAITVLAALLVLGRASDHLGRKPVLLGALGLQVAAMVAFGEADGTAALFGGRIMQGIATGSALGTLGAMMLDVDRERGTRANAVAPGLGSGTGALFSGLIVQYLPAPTLLVYAVFIGIFAVQALGVALLPRGAGRRPGLRTALVPELVVPRRLRRAFLTVAPVLFAVWSLGGFYGSLAPGLARQLSGSNSAVLGALGLFVLTAVSSTTVVVFARMAAKTVMFLGIALLVLGSLCTLAAVEASSITGFFAGTFVSGIGFGAGFQGGMRTVVPLAAEPERPGVLSSIYVLCYLGMGLPAIGAGFLVVYGGGLLNATRDYSLFVITFAVATLIMLLHGIGTRRSAEPPREPRCAPSAKL
ncbi:MFS transporter [Amycolatopsis nivea]|uniref:MFS transporter n=1 Tax=Amycolatopsis nivea TaxID=1644109 RepID=UPI0010701FA8|nr:MFS transporter [Amycolatopsis nivea]